MAKSTASAVILNRGHYSGVRWFFWQCDGMPLYGLWSHNTTAYARVLWPQVQYCSFLLAYHKSLNNLTIPPLKTDDLCYVYGTIFYKTHWVLREIWGIVYWHIMHFPTYGSNTTYWNRKWRARIPLVWHQFPCSGLPRTEHWVHLQSISHCKSRNTM